MKQDVGLEQALQREADAQAICYASSDLLEGIKARCAHCKLCATALDIVSCVSLLLTL